MELLSAEEFKNIEECLNNSLRLFRPLGTCNDLNDCKQLWVHACRTDIPIVKHLDNCNISYIIMLTAGVLTTRLKWHSNVTTAIIAIIL
jgi:hypothetical protein